MGRGGDYHHHGDPIGPDSGPPLGYKGLQGLYRGIQGLGIGSLGLCPS